MIYIICTLHIFSSIAIILRRYIHYNYYGCGSVLTGRGLPSRQKVFVSCSTDFLHNSFLVSELRVFVPLAVIIVSCWFVKRFERSLIVGYRLQNSHYYYKALSGLQAKRTSTNCKQINYRLYKDSDEKRTFSFSTWWRCIRPVHPSDKQKLVVWGKETHLDAKDFDGLAERERDFEIVGVFFHIYSLLPWPHKTHTHQDYKGRKGFMYHT